MLSDKISKLLYAFAGSAADPEERGARVYCLVVGTDPCLIKVKVWHHVIFIEDEAVCIREHERILFYLVITLGDA